MLTRFRPLVVINVLVDDSAAHHSVAFGQAEAALSQRISKARSELDHELQEWTATRVKDIAELESDIAELLAKCAQLRKRWLSGVGDPSSP